MKMKKWMGACLMASMVLSQTPTMVLAQEFEETLVEEMDQTDLVVENEDEKVAGNNVAEFNGTEYKTLQDAINAAKDSTDNNKTIILAANTNEDILIPEGLTLTLQINQGVTLTNQSDHTIINSGILNITGEGTITNISNGKASLINNNGAKAYLNGGKFSRTDQEGNSYYTIVNQGEMEVNNSIVIKEGANNLASCLENGWYTDAEVNGRVSKLTINNGAKISGGIHAVKNDAGGEMKIAGGEITGDLAYTVLNYNKATITGGTIKNTNMTEAKAAIYNNHRVVEETGKEIETSIGYMAIKGGFFEGSFGITNQNTLEIFEGTVKGQETAIFNTASTKIYGGSFEGKTTIINDKKMEIYDGTFYGTSSVVDSRKGSETIIHNGKYTADNYHAVRADGNVIIQDGTFNGGNYKYGTAVRVGSGGEATINGGSFKSGSESEYVIEQAAKTKATVTINGGKFEGGKKNNLQIRKTDIFKVSGGTFTSEIPEEVWTDGFVQATNPDGSFVSHTLQKVTGKTASCTEDGFADYWKCTDPNCGQMYSDEKGQTKIDKPIVIPATGHTYTWVIDKEPTKDEAGAKYQYCVVCHHKTDPVSIPAIGYTEKVENAVYRAYNPNNGEHLYTTNYDEFMHITNIGWHDEGVSFMTEANKEGNPVYRVYNPNSGLHHYTTDENEKNTLVSLGWHDEKVSWYASNKPQSAPVFRVYNPNGGQHHYTMNQQEKNALVSYGWHDEGIAFRTSLVPTK